MARFRMIGHDEESSPTQERVWIVDGYPDFSQSRFYGLKSGFRPLFDLVAYQIDGYFPANFLMPNPISWRETKRVLPSQMAGSQLAILFDGYTPTDGYDGYSGINDGYILNDGYIFLFGHRNSSNIYRATLNNPADFTLAGNLPQPLSHSSLVVVDETDGYASDGYLYLIGGTADGYTPTDHIFSATTSSPLNWTDKGSHLPQSLSHSQLIVLNGQLYLFGGKRNTIASNVIYTAPISNPLNWTDTGLTLPTPLYNSHVAIIGASIYLFGGFIDNNITLSNAILSAPVSNPTLWSQVGTLPFACASGQFVRIGNKGYLICPTATQTTPTKILSCNIADPLTWSDSGFTLPGEISEGQLAIVYDRLFLMGGSGNSAIFACDQILKPDFTDANVKSYGDITRTQIEAEPNRPEQFEILGFAPWKTDYR